jgi:hypothetical protein
MEPVLILNPRRRRRRMPAGLRRYWASRRRAKNPRRRRRAHRRHEYRARRRRNPRRYYRRVHHRARRRNPIGAIGGGDIFSSYLMPGVVGAAGAIAFDVLWGYVEPQLPASFQNGWVATAAELITLWFAIKAADAMSPRSRQLIHRAGLGAATVIAYNALEGLAAQYLPAGTPGLSGYMPSNTRMAGFSLGRMVRPGMAGYMPRQFAGLGDFTTTPFYSPGSVVGPATQQFGGGYESEDTGA